MDTSSLNRRPHPKLKLKLNNNRLMVNLRMEGVWDTARMGCRGIRIMVDLVDRVVFLLLSNSLLWDNNHSSNNIRVIERALFLNSSNSSLRLSKCRDLLLLSLRRREEVNRLIFCSM